MLIAASILAARKLAPYEGGTRVPATVSAIADAVRWAKLIMAELINGGDERHAFAPFSSRPLLTYGEQCFLEEAAKS